ncbi:ATP-dependent DNA helicase fml1-like, partial [Stegodyphus dumicola]|uniref:ATP-dependent DNA helicase fml1-like n=1 Tax=Stegodyphus dumicola TaxID=202533 RepID=UPI0015B19FED
MNKKQKTLYETWNKSPPKEVLKKSGTNLPSSSKAITSGKNTAGVAFDFSSNDIFQTTKYSKNESNIGETSFDHNAGQTWIYPTNHPVRDYQFTIVKEALFKNTLVILPTGLGKTFIAAVVMFNIYRWYPQGKVIFMAPTKPLVAQQVDACFKITGISEEDTTQMT